MSSHRTFKIIGIIFLLILVNMIFTFFSVLRGPDFRKTYHLGLGSRPFSSDGGHFLFSLSFKEAINIYRINKDGTEFVPVTNSKDQSNFGASYSPDGSRIVFSSTEGSRDSVLYYLLTGDIMDQDSRHADIFVMNADGSGRIRLTDTIDHDTFPLFSSDGQKIFFRRAQTYTRVYSSGADSNWRYYDIYSLDPLGVALKRITPVTCEVLSRPSFSPDDTGVVIDTDDGEGFIHIDLNGRRPPQRLIPNLRQLLILSGEKVVYADDRNLFRSLRLRIDQPNFSPDGNSILFEFWNKYPLYIMDIRENKIKQLPVSLSPCQEAAFSPSGEEIICVRHRHDGRPDEIWIMSAEDGRDLRQILIPFNPF